MSSSAQRAFLLLASTFLAPAPQEDAAEAAAFVCPPCGGGCHFVTQPQPGTCGTCGMQLVPLASVPQVGVLVFPDADLLSISLPLGVFGASNSVRAFTLADTRDPLRAADALEFVPQFALGDAPQLDVLVVPDGWGAHEDPLLLEWVARAAARAEHVLAIGMGSIVLQRAGVLEPGRVPANRWLAVEGKELAPELIYDPELPWTRSGKLLLARDGLASVAASLEIVHALAGKVIVRRTAERLGTTWSEEGR